MNVSVSGKTSLQDEVQLLENYLQLEQLRFDHRFEYIVQVDKDLDLFDLEIPPLLVQPYVENAVLHGMAGRESGGRVEVHFKKIKDALEIVIRDNGTGLLEQTRCTNGQQASQKHQQGQSKLEQAIFHGPKIRRKCLKNRVLHFLYTVLQGFYCLWQNMGTTLGYIV